MRKIAVLLIFLFIVVSLCACSEQENASDPIVNAYLKSAQEFVNKGDYTSAITALEEGLQITNNNKLAVYLQEVKKMEENSITQATEVAQSEESTTDATILPTDITTPSTNEATPSTDVTNPSIDETTLPTDVTQPSEPDVTTPDTKQVIDYDYYFGTWSTENISWENGGIAMAIEIEYNYVLIDVTLQAPENDENFNRLIATTSSKDFQNQTIILEAGNEMSSTCALLTLEFEDEAIIMTISDVLSTMDDDPVLSYCDNPITFIKNEDAFDALTKTM